MTRSIVAAVAVALVILVAPLLASVPQAEAALIDSTADGPFASGGTNEEDYNSIVDDLFGYVGDSGNTTVREISCSPWGTCIWVPKYASSTSLSSMNGCNGRSKAFYNMSTNFMVTDEMSQVMQLVAMGNNGTRMARMLNTVRWINSSAGGGAYGPLPEWCVSIDNDVLNLTATTDVASDADARIIDSLYSCSANDNFNSSLRQECYDLAVEMTIEFYSEDLLVVNKQHDLGTYNVTIMPCGGGNVCTALTNEGFMYSGYYGDNAIMLLKACKRTGNASYCGAANNITLAAMMAAGNSSVGYYNGTSLRFPQGVHHNFSNAAIPRPYCTNTCTTSGGWWDYSDAPRFATLGVFEYQATRTSTAHNSNLSTFLTKWAGEGSCISPTAWAVEANAAGVCNSRNAGFYETGVGSHLIIHTNSTLFETWLDAALGSSHYNPSTGKWDTTGEFGAYRQSFPIRSFGIGMGLDEDAYTLYSNATVDTPSMASVSILPSPAYVDSTLAGYCNATADTTIRYEHAWFRNGVALSNWCYQEDPVTANLSGMDGTCGLTYAGSNAHYLDVHGESSPDAEWYVNYTMPSTLWSVNGSLWQVKHGNGGLATYNITLTDQYVTGRVVRLRFSLRDVNGGTSWSVPQAYNGSAWVNIGTNTSGIGNTKSCSYSAAAQDGSFDTDAIWTPNCQGGLTSGALADYDSGIWEEGLWWNTTRNDSFTAGVTQNIGNLTGSFVKADSIILSCRATNGTASDWMNSSALVVSNTAPTSTWGSNNQTFNHNASTVFGGYCSDADAADSLSYWTNHTGFPVLANGSVNFTANVSLSGVYLVNVTCGDGTANTTVTVQLTVTNNAPNASGVIVGNRTGGVNCSFTGSDPDNDAVSGTYRWFRNTTLLSSTGVNLSSGNYSVGDLLKCEVTPSDTVATGSPRNSSAYLVGDTTPPVIVNVSVPSSGSISDILTISATCTDDNAIADGFPKVQWTNPNNVIEGNVSLASTGGGSYAVAYTFNTVGNYRNFTLYCQDGSGNIATNLSSAVLSISAATGSQSGSTGGGGDGESDDGCSFKILQPQEGTDATNPFCPVGGKSKPFRITILNLCSSTRDFEFDIPDNKCASIDTLTLAGNQKGSVELSDCVCPIDKTRTEEFTVTVRQGDYTSAFKVRLSVSTWLAFAANPVVLLVAITGLVVGLVVLALLVWVLKRLTSR